MILCHIVERSVRRLKTQKMRPHFWLHELICKCSCGEVLIHEGQLDLLEAVRVWWGQAIRANSHYRCKLHNAAVGGYPQSCHMDGEATDINIDPNKLTEEKLQEFLEVCAKNGAREVGLYYDKHFCHISVGCTAPDDEDNMRIIHGHRIRVFIRR